MWKQLTGEPVAGELHNGFGGRGRQSPFPTPIPRPAAADRYFQERTFNGLNERSTSTGQRSVSAQLAQRIQVPYRSMYERLTRLLRTSPTHCRSPPFAQIATNG